MGTRVGTEWTQRYMDEAFAQWVAEHAFAFQLSHGEPDKNTAKKDKPAQCVPARPARDLDKDGTIPKPAAPRQRGAGAHRGASQGSPSAINQINGQSQPGAPPTGSPQPPTNMNIAEREATRRGLHLLLKTFQATVTRCAVDQCFGWARRALKATGAFCERCFDYSLIPLVRNQCHNH